MFKSEHRAGDLIFQEPGNVCVNVLKVIGYNVYRVKPVGLLSRKTDDTTKWPTNEIEAEMD